MLYPQTHTSPFNVYHAFNTFFSKFEPYTLLYIVNRWGYVKKLFLTENKDQINIREIVQKVIIED